jgi:nucleoid-associated protein YgaU
MNPQEKEKRPEKCEEDRKETSNKPSRLGKEAKIGAAVIVVLMIVFVAVVIMRLRRSDADDRKPDELAARVADKHKPPDGSHDERLFGEAKSGMFGNSPAKVVPVGSGPTKPPSFDSNDSWKQPLKKDEPKEPGSRYKSPSAPPSFAADPPDPPRPSRYKDVTADRSSGVDADDTGRFHKTPNELRVDQFDPKKSDHPKRNDAGGLVVTRNDFERSESSGRVSTGDGRGFSGERRKPGFDDRSAELGSPTSSRETPSYRDVASRSAPTRPVARYDDDFPRDPGRSTYDRGDSRGFGGSSFDRPPRRQDGKYEIKPGDNYSTISEKQYGTSAYFDALAELNHGKFPNKDRLQPGELISTPPVEDLVRSYPELCPKPSRHETQQSRLSTVSSRSSYNRGRTYTVAEGDTLFNIARYELGKASRWAEIYDLNRDALGKDYNYLTPGMKLVLPDGEKADVLTSRPGDTYR